MPFLVAVFQMRLCKYAVDWQHPLPWHGTIRTRYRSAGSFAKLRKMRNSLPPIMDGGSHLSWMGGTEAHIAHLATHCHTEMPGTLRRQSGRENGCGKAGSGPGVNQIQSNWNPWT